MLQRGYKTLETPEGTNSHRRNTFAPRTTREFLVEITIDIYQVNLIQICEIKKCARVSFGKVTFSLCEALPLGSGHHCHCFESKLSTPFFIKVSSRSRFRRVIEQEQLSSFESNFISQKLLAEH